MNPHARYAVIQQLSSLVETENDSEKMATRGLICHQILLVL